MDNNSHLLNSALDTVISKSIFKRIIKNSKDIAGSIVYYIESKLLLVADGERYISFPPTETIEKEIKDNFPLGTILLSFLTEEQFTKEMGKEWISFKYENDFEDSDLGKYNDDELVLGYATDLFLRMRNKEEIEENVYPSEYFYSEINTDLINIKTTESKEKMNFKIKKIVDRDDLFTLSYWFTTFRKGLTKYKHVFSAPTFNRLYYFTIKSGVYIKLRIKASLDHNHEINIKPSFRGEGVETRPKNITVNAFIKINKAH